MEAESYIREMAEQVEELKLKAGINSKVGQSVEQSQNTDQNQTIGQDQETDNRQKADGAEEVHENGNGPETT